MKKEVKFIVKTKTFRRGEKPELEYEIISAILIFKEKLSKGFLDKFKVMLVTKGDFQPPSAFEDNWGPGMFGRTFQIFVTCTVEVRSNRTIK